MQDAKDYYSSSTSSPYRKKAHKTKRDKDDAELKAECYIGFSKLLKEEMRTFDMKDSVVFELRINSLNKRKTPST